MATNTMDEKSIAPGRTSQTTDNGGASHADHQGYWRQTPLSTMRNPQGTGGLDGKPPTALARPSPRNYPIRNYPVPEKGSGQERFLHMLRESHHAKSPVRVQSCDPPADKAGAISGADSTVSAPSVTEEHRLSVTDKKMKAERSDSYKAGSRSEVAAQQGNLQTMNPLSAVGCLGLQCQIRHFNPEWHITSGPRGFTCSVRIIDKIFYGDHVHNTPEQAKHHVAKKALVYVCGLPCEDPAQRAAAKLHEYTDIHSGSRSQYSRYPSGRRGGENNATVSAGHVNYHGKYAVPTAMNAATYGRRPQSHNGYNEQSALMHRIKSALGETGLGSSVLSDPLASQAFLQGLAVGTASFQRVRSPYDPYYESQRRSYPPVVGDLYRPGHHTAQDRFSEPNLRHGYRARDRSPVRNSSHSYRERSPILDSSRDHQARGLPCYPRRDQDVQRSPSKDVVADKN